MSKETDQMPTTTHWRIQVNCRRGTPDEHWGDLRTSAGKPYEFKTRDEAFKTAKDLYGLDMIDANYKWIVRVVQVVV